MVCIVGGTFGRGKYNEQNVRDCSQNYVKVAKQIVVTSGNVQLLDMVIAQQRGYNFVIYWGG